MTAKKKTHRPVSRYTRQLLDLMDKYAKAHGVTEVDPMDAARWAIQTRQWDEPPEDKVRKLSKLFRRAAREDHFEDENGEPVRRRHPLPYRVDDEPTQKYLWLKMEDMNPGQFRISTQVRRRGMVACAVQFVRDVSYYNKHFNPGAPIDVSVNFTFDVDEFRHGTDYKDSPPPDNSDDDGPSPDLPRQG